MVNRHGEVLKVFDKEMELHEMVKALIEYPELYDFFRENPERKTQLLTRTKQTIDLFKTGQEKDRYILHRALGWLYEVNIYTPDKKRVYNQYDPTLLEVQRELETAWEQFEEERMPELDIPEDPVEFRRWLKQLVLNHPVAEHPIYHYLESECTFEEMSDFFSQEITVDARFDDLVALAQLGTDGHIKMELAENYWDEMGNGEMDKVHTVMFNNLLEELNLTNEEELLTLMDNVSWESLACGNALLNTVLHRKNVYKALGALGALEMMAPKRFSRLVAGFKRLGLTPKAQEYHTLHIAIDTRHGNGWLRNAITPIVAADPNARFDIVKGAFYRLHTSLDYCNKLYSRYKNKGLVS